MDRRLTPYSGRKALFSLQGQLNADFVEGEAFRVNRPVIDLLKSPHGARDRQLLWGDKLLVIDRDQGQAFVQAQKDGFCGWIDETSLQPDYVPTHWVAARASHLYSGPKVQAAEICALPLGAEVQVTGFDGNFAITPQGCIPKMHLRALSDRPTDPVAVAESLLGTPYLWGGNSHAGIDCSGLAQVSLLACGIAAPGDSDQQQALGRALPAAEPLQRGDLLFWKGHIALVANDDLMIHANGHTMNVAYEGISAGIQRIIDQNGGPVTHRRRL